MNNTPFPTADAPNWSPHQVDFEEHESTIGVASANILGVIGYTHNGVPYPWDPKDPFNYDRLVARGTRITLYQTTDLDKFKQAVLSYQRSRPRQQATPPVWDMTEGAPPPPPPPALPGLDRGTVPDITPEQPFPAANQGRSKNTR